MFRANHPRGEDVPPVARESAVPTSVEALLALSLCTVVILACMAFLRRSSDYSRALEDLQHDLARERPRESRRSGPSTEPRPELVIVVTLDSLRADHLEFHGYARETAPHLSALAREGLVFRTVAAQSSHALTSYKSLLTGKYPATLMLEETGADLAELASLRSSHEYLAGTFAGVRGLLAAGFEAGGYRTAAFTDGGATGRARGFAHGFGLFDDAGGGLAASLARALAWLLRQAGSPALVFVQAADLRCPYTAREPSGLAFCRAHESHRPLEEACASELEPADLEALSDHYDGALASLDDALGTFIDELRARGLYERALIVVTAGHGESLGERGRVGHGGLQLEELHVPLVLKFPGDWRLAPTTLEEPVELVDLLPTLFGLCGLTPPGDLDGRSLLPTLLRGVRAREYLVAQTSFEAGRELRSSAAMRTLLRPGRWQVIHDVEQGQASFYALDDDPGALAPHPVAAAELPALLQLLLAHGESRPLLRAAEPANLAPELERELTRLGYGAAAAAGQGGVSDLR